MRRKCNDGHGAVQYEYWRPNQETGELKYVPFKGFVLRDNLPALSRSRHHGAPPDAPSISGGSGPSTRVDGIHSDPTHICTLGLTGK
jgi:hypothetical protein